MDILLIEDNPGDILLIQDSFEGFDGYKPNLIIKKNGIEASTFINECTEVPDLVIMDLNLPYRNGFELLTEMNRTNRFQHIPVIFFTSSNSEFDRTKAIALGAKAFITKSIDFEEYRRQVLSFPEFVVK